MIIKQKVNTNWNRFCTGAVLAALLLQLSAGKTHAEPESPVNRISASKPVARKGQTVPLPPLAVVLEEDTDGNTWRETGEISGNLEITQKNFQRSLAREGWVLRRTIPLARGVNRSALCLWQRGGRELLVMLWQKEPGKCGFSWGIPE